MILQLVNSKGRVVFAAQDDGNVDHESGGGWINKPEECFLSAACTLADNPSCEVSGDYAERFITYCQKLTWMPNWRNARVGGLLTGFRKTWRRATNVTASVPPRL